jgi:hypothetical protein
MNPATDFLVEGPSGPVAGTFSYDAGSFTVTFTPDDDLEPLTTYTVTVSGEVDAGGDEQQVPVSWSFETADATVVSYTIYAPYVSKAPASQSSPVNLAPDKNVPLVFKSSRDSGETADAAADGLQAANGRQPSVLLANAGSQQPTLSNQWLWRAWPWLMLVVGVGALLGYLKLAERRKEFILDK